MCSWFTLKNIHLRLYSKSTYSFLLPISLCLKWLKLGKVWGLEEQPFRQERCWVSQNSLSKPNYLPRMLTQPAVSAEASGSWLAQKFPPWLSQESSEIHTWPSVSLIKSYLPFKLFQSCSKPLQFYLPENDAKFSNKCSTNFSITGIVSVRIWYPKHPFI